MKKQYKDKLAAIKAVLSGKAPVESLLPRRIAFVFFFDGAYRMDGEVLTPEQYESLKKEEQIGTLFTFIESEGCEPLNDEPLRDDIDE